MSMSFEKLYPSKHGYAVLNVDGPNVARDAMNKKVVFHRVTKSDKISCNGTWCNDGERHEFVPTAITAIPCKRCFGYGKVR